MEVMQSKLCFKHDGYVYSAEYRKEGLYYLIHPIRVDFEDGLADIRLRPMQIRPIIEAKKRCWVDGNGETTELVQAMGEQIDETEKTYKN